MSSQEKPSRNLHLRTYGCAMNVQDSARIEGLLAREGYRLVEREEDADVVIVNTCAIRESSEQRIFGELGRLRRLRDLRPDVALGVGGCVA
ncbi:MAG: tRNA (N6-isopentenyl adenosine(37)-C2)-methylthiotransferase MiaB, partial [Candidatus Methylomirabilis sp.]|nr:tRNA (N6-isopentenyl adenosine(37)-C2)-methylthiotransferase MiaB [Deltaproteobacteria bacterium]